MKEYSVVEVIQGSGYKEPFDKRITAKINGYIDEGWRFVKMHPIVAPHLDLQCTDVSVLLLFECESQP